jgi:hypothetical protein
VVSKIKKSFYLEIDRKIIPFEHKWYLKFKKSFYLEIDRKIISFEHKWYLKF